jgi:hypothetical protein
MKTPNTKHQTQVILKISIALLMLFNLINTVQAQWTVISELDCPYKITITCDDDASTGTSPTMCCNFWNDPGTYTINGPSCPCSNTHFTIDSDPTGYGNGAKTFTLSYYLSQVSSTYGGTGHIDPNDGSDPSNEFLYCCCNTCPLTSPSYDGCIGNGCAAILINADACTITLKKPTGCR